MFHIKPLRIRVKTGLDLDRRQDAPVEGRVLAPAPRDVAAPAELDVAGRERMLYQRAQDLDAVRPAGQERVAREHEEALVAAHRVELARPEVEHLLRRLDRALERRA